MYGQGEKTGRGLRRILVALLVLAVSIGTTRYAQAAPKEMPDGSIFDPEYYAANNPDVVAALGTDELMLYQHYLLFGKAEGRQPYAEGSTTTQTNTVAANIAKARIDSFRATWFYKQWYDEAEITREADGLWIKYRDYSRWDAASWGPWTWEPTHYDDPSYYFNAAQYAADYPAVAAAVGTSKEALWNHYSTVGVYQGYRAHGTTQYVEAKQLACDVVEKLCSDPAMTDVQRIRAIHDWISGYVTYSYDNSHQHLYQAIYNQVAVCGGYADTFDYMVSALGIPCDYIYGTVSGGGWHAWNRVALGGQWYYVDVTWDDDQFNGGTTATTYFMITGDEINRDHLATKVYDNYSLR